MCDVPSIAVFCGGSIECFPGIVSKFFFNFIIIVVVIITLFSLLLFIKSVQVIQTAVT